MVYFELLVIVATLVIFFFLRKSQTNLIRNYIITIIAVLIFEYLTSDLFVNTGLEFWAYLYKDVSWIITLGWANIIIVSIAIIDKVFQKISEGKRFAVQLIFITIVGLLAEMYVRFLGIREYTELAQKSLSGVMIGNIPIEALYYIPVFMALVISFKRYWEISFNEKSKVRGKKK